MVEGAGGGEAEGACGYGFACEPRHRRDVGRGCCLLIECPLTHDLDSQGRMRHLGREVDVVRAGVQRL